jgi:hypothetical protein
MIVASGTAEEDFRMPFSLKGTPATGHFTLRPSKLGHLEQHFLLPHQSPLKQVYVVHGLGGIEKTQLALEYAVQHKDDYSAIFWLNGNDKKSLERSLAGAAARIIPTYSGEEPSRSSIENNSKVLAETALKWLSRDEN